MGVYSNSNIKLLTGGAFLGDGRWDRKANKSDNCYKLYYLKNGTVEITSEYEIHQLKSPGLYLINGHKMTSHKCVEKFSVDWLHFLPESVYYNHLLRYSKCIHQLNLPAFESFKPLFALFGLFFSSNQGEFERRITVLEIQAFVQFTMAQILKNSDDIPNEADSKLLQLLPALEFIHLNYNKNISLGQIAEHCSLSPNYFHRLFSQTFDTSPWNYVRKIRLEEALRQLSYTNKTVKEIAYDIGFEDEAYFSRVFSKEYHISPGRYRKENSESIP